MHYVYIIKSDKTGSLYFGRTDDLAQRLKNHNSGRNFSTKEQKPWRYYMLNVIYQKKMQYSEN
ncbi:GIY-YIG nuclease family protein [Candidatus Wolfebacteria bacterium]|nr:GIY-YIG nuclease family protein [Candidatus Wolfebacteria bacterium]